MQRHLIFFLVFGLVCFGVSAQDAAPRNSVENTASANSADSGGVLPIILHGDVQGIPLQSGSFILPDGTALSSGELKQRLLTVPENGKYLNHAMGWTVGHWISLGALGGLAAAEAVYMANAGLPYRDDVLSVLGITFVLPVITDFLCIIMRDRNLKHAVRDYNLTIMGLRVY
jgi:hypothetical protein